MTLVKRRGLLSREEMPHIEIRPRRDGFHLLINGCSIRTCLDEGDAHHWGKHAFEAVNDGLRTPSDVAEGTKELCRQATRFNLHT